MFLKGVKSVEIWNSFKKDFNKNNSPLPFNSVFYSICERLHTCYAMNHWVFTIQQLNLLYNWSKLLFFKFNYSFEEK